LSVKNSEKRRVFAASERTKSTEMALSQLLSSASGMTEGQTDKGPATGFESSIPPECITKGLRNPR
jgi:hypothetical protein